MKKIIILAASALLFASGAAQAGNFGVGARASTLGVGYDASFTLTDYLVLRGGINSYSTDYDTTEDDIDYNFDADLDSKHLFLDIHPFAGNFRVTGGFVDNNSEFVGTGTSTGDFTINGVTYTPAEVGTLRAGFGLKERGTYFGIGWGTAPRSSGFGFSFDVGILQQDAPQAIIVPEGGTLIADPVFQADIQAEEDKLNEDLSDFDTYPVVSLGISYKF